MSSYIQKILLVIIIKIRWGQKNVTVCKDTCGTSLVTLFQSWNSCKDERKYLFYKIVLCPPYALHSIYSPYSTQHTEIQTDTQLWKG